MREELKKFAEKMEKILKENDYKGGWKEDNLLSGNFLQQKLMEEVAEYFRSIEKEPGFTPIEVTRDFSDHLIGAGNEISDTDGGHGKRHRMKELVDIANVCMMLYDNLKEENHSE